MEPNEQFEGKYSHLLADVEGELKSAKEQKVKEALQSRIAKLEAINDQKATLEHEIKQLLATGKITDLNTMIKINVGEDKGKSAPLMIERNDQPDDTHIGIMVSAK